ncbi:MAG: hypothetical protein KTR30_15035 [Saprospiraceae bacterium]|nr:hypothetical protein [Saprospiraceae bacterium]
MAGVEARGKRSEVRSQMSEVRGQKSEVRGQMSDGFVKLMGYQFIVNGL